MSLPLVLWQSEEGGEGGSPELAGPLAGEEREEVEVEVRPSQAKNERPGLGVLL